MLLKNPYTKGTVEYPIDFEINSFALGRYFNYHIVHETPFTQRRAEWAVSHLKNGDTIYIPYGANRCKDIYIVTSFFLDKTVTFPYGIYTLPLSYFSREHECFGA